MRVDGRRSNFMTRLFKFISFFFPSSDDCLRASLMDCELLLII